MRILTRHLLRAHLGPFLFSLSVLTALLFLNAVAQRMERLAGKGLGWEVFGEFMALTLPHVVALTLPMAVLVSVLYALSELSSGHELTAIAAGGVPPSRILLPLLGVGLLLSGVMFYFNDRVLPESNFRLQSLMLDIGAKRPTLELREQVVNRIEAGGSAYYLQARSIDPVTSEMEEVVIHDLTQPLRQRTIEAERGSMAFTPDGADLLVTLYRGTVHELGSQVAGEYRQSRFGRQIFALEGVGSMLERRDERVRRSDREMSIAMLREDVARARQEEACLAGEIARRSILGLESALGLPPSPAPEHGTPGSGICMPGAPSAGGFSLPPATFESLPQSVSGDPLTTELAGTTRQALGRIRAIRVQEAQSRVEIHKKFSISAACLIFILLGVPIALRFASGGVGMAIAVSAVVFSVYWAGLIGGERLADRGRADPWIAMWAANLFFLLFATPLLLGMARSMSTGRGGTWEELRFRVGAFAGSLLRRETRDMRSAP